MVSFPLRSRVLYHVTLARNRSSIVFLGLRKGRARSDFKRVWLCDYLRLRWAAAHVRQSHKWHGSKLLVVQVSVRGLSLTKRRAGIYYCESDIESWRIVHAFDVH